MALIEDTKTNFCKLLRNKKFAEANITKLEVQAINKSLVWIWNNYKHDIKNVSVIVFTDCLEAVNIINQKHHGWYLLPGIKKKSRMKQEWKELCALTAKLRVSAKHLKSHTGEPMNEMVDKLAGMMHNPKVKPTPEFPPFTWWTRMKLFLGRKI